MIHIFMFFRFKYLFVALLCWGLILTTNFIQKTNENKSSHLTHIQATLNKLDAYCLALIGAAINHENTGRRLKEKNISYFVYSNQNLIYWNQNDETLIQSHREGFNEKNNTLLYCHSVRKNNLRHVYSIPILNVQKETAGLEKKKLLSPDQKQVAFIQTSYSPGGLTRWLYLMWYILGLFSSMLCIKDLAVGLINNQKIISGLLTFTFGIFLVRIVSLFITKNVFFPDSNFFNGEIKPSQLSPTLLDLLINILIISMLVWFVRLHVRPRYFKSNNTQNHLIAILNYFLVYVSSVIMIQIFRQLVLGSGISFDFEYVFYLDLKSLIALVGILTLAISLFILDLHLLRIIRHLGLEAKSRLASNGIALLFIILILFVLPINFPLILILGIAGYLTLLDISTDYLKPKASWYLIWTITGAVLIASILYQFHIEKDILQRNEIINQLKEELILNPAGSPSQKEYGLRKKLAAVVSGSSYLALYEIVTIPDLNVIAGNHKAFSEIDASSSLYLAKKTNPLFKVCSFFSYIFILLNIILLVLHLLNSKLKWFTFSIFKIFPSNQTLRYRIQTSMLLMSICSFMLIAAVIVFYVKKNTDIWHNPIENVSLNELPDINLLKNTNGSFLVYNQEGLLLPEKIERMDFDDWNSIKKGNGEVKIKSIIQNNVSYFVKPNNEQLSLQTKRKLNDFLGALLNVYVFLLIGIVLLSMLVANSIAKPLTILSTKLKQIQVGGSNQKLEWNRQDELGGLIRNYNEMIQELDRSTRMLALTERETAWREMAKQVAHEIKNPLTPMKLITQHLQNSISRTDHDEIPALVRRVTQTLIEQIENLSKIASEFSNFAKLPAPENEKIALNEVVTSTHDLFRKREDMDIHLRVPIDEIYVFADKNHIIRVLTNLIKNAIQAIPLGRRGRIEIILYKHHKRAIIKVTDNGCGIPDSMKDKVFYPNFTTKNSGTGLGLAIVRDIIDSCNGHIYFHTSENKGTEFFVELPLMHMEDNFREVERVSL